METADHTVRSLCDLARGSSSLVGWRSEALQILRTRIDYEGALFHELSPRVSLDRAAYVRLDRETIERSSASWDELAVVFGRLRELASTQGGVSSTDEAFPQGTRGRKAWNTRVGRMLHAPEALVAHLSIGARIVSGILLVRPTAFHERERQTIRALVPVLSVCDGLRQALDTGHVEGQVAELQCVDQRLTPRQRELVVLVALGRTDAEIAQALEISANTVRNQLVLVRRRLGAANRAEVVRSAVLR